MDADVKLDKKDGKNILILEGDRITVNGEISNSLTLKGPDLQINCDERYSGGHVQRRALVHDFDDSLTINYWEDYPKGVNILGKVRIPGDLEVNNSLYSKSLTVDGSLIIGMGQPGVMYLYPGPETITIEGSKIKVKQIKKKNIIGESKYSVDEFDLVEEVLKLREEIAALRKRLEP